MCFIMNFFYFYDVVGNNLIVIVNVEDRENVWIGEVFVEYVVISMLLKVRGFIVVNIDYMSVGV